MASADTIPRSLEGKGEGELPQQRGGHYGFSEVDLQITLSGLANLPSQNRKVGLKDSYKKKTLGI